MFIFAFMAYNALVALILKALMAGLKVQFFLLIIIPRYLYSRVFSRLILYFCISKKSYKNNTKILMCVDGYRHPSGCRRAPSHTHKSTKKKNYKIDTKNIDTLTTEH